MKQEEYIKERIDDQIEWYSKKSSRAQLWFKSMRIFEISAASTIPFLAGYASETNQIIIGLLGVCIAIVAGIISINKFQETWIQYRTTSESLKHHKYLYQTESKPYDGENSFKMLVATTEALISKENSNWNIYIKQIEERENG